MAAFLNRVGNLLKQNISRRVSSEFSASNASLFQAMRSMSTSSKLFVGGLSYNTDETSLREAFSQYGEVVEARIIMDRETGRSRGFAFITYTSSESASSAIQALDGQDLHGRRVRVNYATEKARGGGFGGGFGAGAGGSGGYDYGGQGGNYGHGGYGGGDGSYGGGSGYGGGNQYPSGGGYQGGYQNGGGGGSGSSIPYPGAGGGFGGRDNYPTEHSGFGGPYTGNPINLSGNQNESQGAMAGGHQEGFAAANEDFQPGEWGNVNKAGFTAENPDFQPGVVDEKSRDDDGDDEPGNYADTRR